MRTLRRYAVLATILGLYCLLYVATSKNDCLYDDCYKFVIISDSLNKNPFVKGSNKCNTNQFCVYVNDSIARNWAGISDTTCRYLQEKEAPHFIVSVISFHTQDTLLNRQCP